MKMKLRLRGLSEFSGNEDAFGYLLDFSMEYCNSVLDMLADVLKGMKR